MKNNLSPFLFRLQIQGELANGVANTEYRGMIRTALGIAREEVSVYIEYKKVRYSKYAR
jgi:hypothetical protein